MQPWALVDAVWCARLQVFQRCYAARLRLEASLVAQVPTRVGADHTAGHDVATTAGTLEETCLGMHGHGSVIELVRAECSRWLLPVDMGSGVVDAVCNSIVAEGDWRPFDALVGKLDAHSARCHALGCAG